MMNTSTKEVRRTSKAWHYFEEQFGQSKARCTICNEVYSFHGHSSNLFKHLKRMHRREAIALGVDPGPLGPEPVHRHRNEKAKALVKKELGNQTICLPIPLPPLTLTPSVKPPQKKVEKSQILSVEKKRLLDEKVVAMIALDLQPVSIVENRGFADMMHVADPTYSLPSRAKILNELLPHMYNSTVEQVRKTLEGVPKVALTTDLWPAGNQTDYLTVAAYFISETDWSCRSVNLSTSIFYGSYTGDDIGNEIERNIAKWNLTDKVTMMITDSATNLLLASQNFPWGIIPCLAHLIHLVVSDAISEDMEVSSLIERVQDVVNFFYYNTEATQRLTDIQRSLNVPENKLVQGVLVRWNSIFYMFERMVEQMDAVNTTLTQLGREDKCLPSGDRELMTLTLTSLKPFEIVAKTLSLDKGTRNTIGMAMPLMEGLHKMMISLKDAIMEPFTSSLKAGLVKRFEQMWDSEWIVAATLLDPRYKKFPFANKSLQEKATENIIGEVSIIMELTNQKNGDGDDHVMTESEEDALWNYLDSDVAAVQETKAIVPISAAYREVHRYLDSAPIPRKECPLLFWKQHVELLPNLSQVALKYMSVPATSTASNKFFSKAGELLAEKKSRLRPQTLDMVLFLNKNLP